MLWLRRLQWVWLICLLAAAGCHRTLDRGGRVTPLIPLSEVAKPPLPEPPPEPPPAPPAPRPPESTAVATLPMRPPVVPPPALITPPEPTLTPEERPVVPPVLLPERTRDGWVSLNTWADLNRWPEPRLVQSGTNDAYRVATAQGMLEVALGKPQARWAGVELWLSHAPKLVEREPHLHALDARLKLAPLLTRSESAPFTNRVIVIDPGHGGENPGARSCVSDRYEKDLTLDWARCLRPLLEADGWEVWLTRNSDVDLALPDRAAFADKHHAALFISLHFNSAPGNGDQAGLETYCLTPPGLPSNLVRGAAEDVQALFPNNQFDADNLRLAVRLHRALLEQTGRPDRGVRHARFMGVLRWQNRPAVLLEGGYLSHPREARLIESAAYRQQLAEAVAKALSAPDSAAVAHVR